MRLYSLPGLARSESSLRRTNRFRPGAEQLDDRLVPAGLDPVYMATFGDAVTDDNAFSASGYRQWTIDAGADVYQTDTYERPVAQTFKVVRDASGTQQFAASEYFQNLDIVQARAGFDDTFLYVAVKVAGLSKLTDDGKVTPEGLAYRYGFRIATQADGGGGLLVTADQPQFKNSPNTTFGQVGTFVYRDANGDVGGTGRDVTKQDRQAEVGGNGYERVAASDGRLSNGPVGPLRPSESERPDRGRVCPEIPVVRVTRLPTCRTCRTSLPRPTRASRTRATTPGMTSTRRARRVRHTGRRSAT